MKKTAAIFIIIFCLSVTSINAADAENEKPVYSGSAQPTTTESEPDKDWSIFLEVMARFQRDYYKEISEREFAEKVLRGGIPQIDRFSRYFPPEETKTFWENINGHYSGIGMALGQKDDGEKTHIIIMSVMKNCPAEKAGIQKRDFIIGISSEGIKNKAVYTERMGIHEATELIKGKAGTKVYLMIKRDGEILDFFIERAEIKDEKITSFIIRDKIGYIKISEFEGDDLDIDFKRAVKKIRRSDIKCLIIDLRENPGGLLHQAVNISNLFRKKPFSLINNPPIVYMEMRKGEEAVRGSILDGGDFKNLELVILANNGSASASEVVTAYLKHYCGAKVVGKTTYGKGVGQSVQLVNRGGLLLVTSFEYLVGPDKVAVHGKGISPDYEVEDNKEGEEDLQMKKAIEVAEEMIKK